MAHRSEVDLRQGERERGKRVGWAQWLDLPTRTLHPRSRREPCALNVIDSKRSVWHVARLGSARSPWLTRDKGHAVSYRPSVVLVDAVSSLDVVNFVCVLDQKWARTRLLIVKHRAPSPDAHGLIAHYGRSPGLQDEVMFGIHVAARSPLDSLLAAAGATTYTLRSCLDSGREMSEMSREEDEPVSTLHQHPPRDEGHIASLYRQIRPKKQDLPVTGKPVNLLWSDNSLPVPGQLPGMAR